jgi:hypothetical protein
VVTHRSVQAWRRLARELRSRAGERGTAVFVVLLVLTVLSAIGVFAARAAGLNQRTSGYERGSTQAGYVSDYGANIMLTEMEKNSWPAMEANMDRGTENCQATMYIDAAVGDPARGCVRLTLSEFQGILVRQGSPAIMFDPTGGSLGPAPVNRPAPEIVVEVSDKGAGAIPPGQTKRGKEVTVTAYGAVRPVLAQDGGGACVTPQELQSVQVSGTKSTKVRTTLRPQ